jgi:hypothetical protein
MMKVVAATFRLRKTYFFITRNHLLNLKVETTSVNDDIKIKNPSLNQRGVFEIKNIRGIISTMSSF